MQIPAFFEALQDKSLRGPPREVYLWLNQRLDVVEFRPVKVAEMESALDMTDSTAARALQRVVEAGYVESGQKIGRIRSFRLFYSRSSAILGP